MNIVTIVYVKSEGTLGLILREYPDDVVRVRWYVDGFGYTADLEPDEYEVRLVGFVNE